MTDVAAVVLAAGTASRYRAADPAAASKLVADFRGRPLVRHAVEAATASRARPVIVVTGYARAGIEAALADAPVRCVFNPSYAAGLASSLQAGIAAVPPAASGALVLLGDMPLVGAGLLDRLIAAFAAQPHARAVVPVVRGVRGNPVLLSRALFAAVDLLTGDAGARKLLADDGAVLELPSEDEGAALDIDMPDALRRLGP